MGIQYDLTGVRMGLMETKPASWTHPSVVNLARGRDPVQVVTGLARDLVARAYDQGWSGPPFDPFALATLQRIKLTANHEIRDARIVHGSRHGFRVEFNPQRPGARVRYSIAHEIAHTLFPDCADQVRNRSQAEEMAGDEWQLESLCNLAAAEFLMPVGSFRELCTASLEVEDILQLRRQFAVSMEAILIRTVRLTERACMMFVASRIEHSEDSEYYRMDYCVPSVNWSESIPQAGIRLPRNSCVAQCTKIGFTAKGNEKWRSQGPEQHLECVGLPPHPRSLFPRVAGIAKARAETEERCQITYVRGDATEPRAAVALIVQVVNDATPNWGGRGFAVAVKRKWGHVQQSFRHFADENGLRLGAVHISEAEPDIWVASVIAQKGYGDSVKPRIRYSALRSGLARVAGEASRLGATLHMPRVGCGEGRGDWGLISDLIRSECVGRGLSVYIYDLPDAPRPASDRAHLPFEAEPSR